MSKLSAQRTAHAVERMAVYHLDAPMVGVAPGAIESSFFSGERRLVFRARRHRLVLKELHTGHPPSI